MNWVVIGLLAALAFLVVCAAADALVWVLVIRVLRKGRKVDTNG